MSAFFETLDRIRPRLEVLQEPLQDSQAAAASEPARSLVVETARAAVVTLPIRESALNYEDFLTRINGRLVGAEQPNRNNQFWTTGDLAFGVDSVVGGPLNWLHEERHIVGALLQAELKQEAKQLASSGSHAWTGPHIEARSVMWSFLWPAETAAVKQAAATGDLYYSMECVSREVECTGPSGCGRVMSYADSVMRSAAACEHVRERSAVRRLINPVFQGAALIVPPVRPGWANAHAEVMKRAAASEELQAFTDGQVEVAAQILSFVSDGNNAR